MESIKCVMCSAMLVTTSLLIAEWIVCRVWSLTEVQHNENGFQAEGWLAFSPSRSQLIPGHLGPKSAGPQGLGLRLGLLLQLWLAQWLELGLGLSLTLGFWFSVRFVLGPSWLGDELIGDELNVIHKLCHTCRNTSDISLYTFTKCWV